MIKQLLILVIFLVASTAAFAQQTGGTGSVRGATDTVRSPAAQQGKVKMVNGTAMNSGQDVMYNFSQSPDYSMFIKAVRAGGLIETFRSRGPITVFVPDNVAFNSFGAGQMDSLLKQNHLLELDNLVTYHAVKGTVSAKDIAKLIKDNNGQAEILTIAGGKLTAHIDANRNIVLVDENGGESIISTFDIPQSNGMAHLITKVLVPKYKVI